MRSRFLLVILLALAAIAAFVGKRVFYPTASSQAATTTVAPAQSYLLILGVGDTTATVWDGSITVTGASIQILRGWRFSGTDAISGTTSWKLSTRESPSLKPPGPVQENGLIVKISDTATPATFNITTTQGNFSFSTQDLPFGTSKTFLNGRAFAAQTGAQFQLTSSTEEEDFPSMAQSGDDIYLTYTEFVHGDRSVATGTGTAQPIADFSFLARPAGGDQVFLMHYSISQRVWTGPFSVTGTGEDAMRSAVAVDGQGRAWILDRKSVV